MEILLATSNLSKIKEMKDVLEPLGHTIYTPFDYGLTVSVDENGSTFLQNALIKAKAFNEVVDIPVLGDDSGLIVPSLNGEPGVLSARYAGDTQDDLANINKLLYNMKDVSNRDAYFMTVLVLRFKDGSYIVGEGATKGYITTTIKGNNGFGYDPIFYSNSLEKTFGEASDTEKERASHRTRALYDLLSKM